MKLGNNTYLVAVGSLEPNYIGVRLWGTDVVRFWSDGRVTLHTYDRGRHWRTITTKDRINQFISERVYQRKHEWFVVYHTADGALDWEHPVPFQEGILVGRKVIAGKKPPMKALTDGSKEFADRINPRNFNFSPKLTAMVGAIIGHDYGVRDSRGGYLSSLSITSDGYLMAASTVHESGAFVGTAEELDDNLSLWKLALTPEDRKRFEELYASNVRDWRRY